LKQFKHLKGHFGNAWQKQGIDFKNFPGPIVMTSNCLIEPRPKYKHRIFTMNSVGWEGVRRINNLDFSEVIKSAHEEEGFKESNMKNNSSIKNAK